MDHLLKPVFLFTDPWNGSPFWYSLIINLTLSKLLSHLHTCNLERKFDDFTLYFLAFNHDGKELTPEEKTSSRFSREGLSFFLSPQFLSTCSSCNSNSLYKLWKGVLELTHNHGTESDPNFQGYANGNSEPGKGFGHIAISVDDVDKACERFDKLGVQFKKRPTDGKMRNIAFILDPDGWVFVNNRSNVVVSHIISELVCISFSYWVEIVPCKF